MSLSDDPQIFDRQILRLRRQRRAGDFDDFDFLKQEVSNRLADRLGDIRRDFPIAVDLGAHHGSLGKLLLKRPDLEKLVSTDLCPSMAASAPGLRVVADEEFLPFADESLHLVASSLSLHWVNDLPGTLVQINRALRPDGLLLAALFGGETLTELRQAFLQAEMAIDGGASPRVSPFVDVRDAGDLLQRAGFALSVADTERIIVDYSDALSLMRDLRGMGESNILHTRKHGNTSQKLMMAVAEAYADMFARADGRIPATFDILFLTGWAPHESQQKPLAPGSAKMRLADALGVKEYNAGEKAGR